MTDYQRSTYTLTRFEVVAPHVLNNGCPSGYAEAFREALTDVGVTGWTELDTAGYWYGKRETSTTFVIFAEEEWSGAGVPLRVRFARLFNWSEVRPTEDLLARIARACMPDQDAVQVVKGEAVTLVEG